MLDVIIPAAGAGRRMRSYGPKCLINLNKKENIIVRQLRILESVFGEINPILVVGYQFDKIKKRNFPIKLIVNHIFDLTNVAFSLNLALRTIRSPEVLIVYGDLVFGENIFKDRKNEHSWLMVDKEKYFDDHEVGINYGQQINILSYGLPEKWAQIAYLTGKELELTRRCVNQKSAQNFLGFEIMNCVIDNGGQLFPYIANDFIVDVDTVKDLNLAKTLVNEHFN